MTHPAPVPDDVDPFDLPGWLGEKQVTWEADHRMDGHLVPGRLTAPGEELPCDLLAVDQAYPVPVAPDSVRTRAHQVWRHGQVLLVAYDGRLTLACPGRGFDAARVLLALDRLAHAVGAEPENYAALVRLGGEALRPGDDG